MASAHELARGHKRLRTLIEFALGEGWKVVHTRGGHPHRQVRAGHSCMGLDAGLAHVGRSADHPLIAVP